MIGFNSIARLFAASLKRRIVTFLQKLMSSRHITQARGAVVNFLACDRKIVISLFTRGARCYFDGIDSNKIE